MPDLLAHYGAALLFVWAFAVQAGLPAPAIPMLVGAGALSGTGHMNLALAMAAAVAATLGADVLWYGLGRSTGTRALGALCRFSMDPDSFIRDAKERFLAHRARYVIMAKFLPGLNPLAAGLAGAASVPLRRFLLYAGAGALLWAGVWILLGYVFADVIGIAIGHVSRVGKPVVAVLVVALLVYLGSKYVRRRRFLRHLSRARITPAELNRRLVAGDRFAIFDLRTALDIETTPFAIPGARWIAPDTLRHPQHLIEPDGEVIFYCAEPREATSARMALRLAASGFHNVHPLSGGLEGWRQAGFAVESVSASPPAQKP